MHSRIVLVLACLCPLALAQNGAEHWVATWAASPQAPRAGATNVSFNNQTIRMIVHTSIGGRRARVQFSNAFGIAPLVIGSAHVALRGKESEIVPGSDRALTFSGKPGATIPPGAPILSDPVTLDVPKLGDLAVSVFLPGDTGPATMHATGLHSTYISKSGDATAQPAIADATVTRSWFFVSSVDVLAPADTALIVAFGDSITDGATSTPDTDSSWPSFLANRLGTSNFAVVNQGISGNRILRENTGVNALARFDRDVLSQAGVKWVILLEGINDIGVGMRTPAEAVTADEVIAGQKQLIERAHLHGLKIAGGTLTPYLGAAYYSDAGETVRTAVNQWIRTSGTYDAVIDFDAATKDPGNPKQLRPAYNIMDHLHPNDAGYKAMADAIDLSIFTKR